MPDNIPGEVLQPAIRFIPDCEHHKPTVHQWLEAMPFTTIETFVECEVCGIPYRKDLPYDVGVKPER